MNQQLMEQRIYEYNNSMQAAPYYHQPQTSLQDCKSQALPQMNYPYYYYGPTRVESGFDTDSQMPPFSESQEEVYDPYYPTTSQRSYLPSIRHYADMALQPYQDEQMQEPKQQHSLERQQFKLQQQQQINQYPEQLVLFEQKQLFPEPYDMSNNKYIPVNNHPFLYNGQQYVCGGYPNQEIYTSIPIPQNQPQSYGCFPVINVPQYEQQCPNNQISTIHGNVKQEEEITAPAVALGIKEIENKAQINNIQVKLESNANIEKRSYKKNQDEEEESEEVNNEQHNESNGVSKSSKKIGKTDKTKKKYKQSRQKNVFKNFGNALINCIQNNFMIRDLIEKNLNHDNTLLEEFHSAFLKDSLNNLKNKEDFLQGWRASETADSPNIFLFKKIFKLVSLKFFTDYAEKYVNESDKLKNKDIHIKAIRIFIRGLENVNELYKFKLS